jgi:hypothetical protein
MNQDRRSRGGKPAEHGEVSEAESEEWGGWLCHDVKKRCTELIALSVY